MESLKDTLPDLYKVGTTDSIFEELDIVKGYHTILEIPKDSDSLSLPSLISTFSPISSEEELFNLDKLLDSYPSSPESTTTAFSPGSNTNCRGHYPTTQSITRQTTTGSFTWSWSFLPASCKAAFCCQTRYTNTSPIYSPNLCPNTSSGEQQMLPCTSLEP